MLYSSGIKGIANRHAHQRKIARAAFTGFEIGAMPVRPQKGNGHSRQDFVVLQDIFAPHIPLRAGKKLFERQRALPSGASEGHASPKR